MPDLPFLFFSQASIAHRGNGCGWQGFFFSLKVLAWLISVASAPKTVLIHSALKPVIISISEGRACGPAALGQN